MFEPVAGIAQQSAQCVADLVVRDPDVFFGGPVDACPLPRLVEHSTVQVSEIRFGQRILPANIPRSEGPAIGHKNIRPLELVKLFLHGEVGNEVGLSLIHI